MANRVRVNRVAIQSMFLPGGPIGRAGQIVANTIEREAIRAAPRRTGALKSSIASTRSGTNQNGATYTVYSTADYALFVEEGTRPVITSDKGQMLRLPAYGRRPEIRTWWVSGQEGKHYLRRGLQNGLHKGLRAARRLA